MAKTHDPVANGIDYAERVIAHKIDAPKYVRLACQRFERDYTAARAGDGLWTFDLEKARRPLQLCEKLPNIKGPYAGQPIELMGWQCWCSINITGFVERGTKLRRFRQASIWCPRGNGKSSWIAPLALYFAFADGEGGAEAYAAAVTRDQAKIVWETAWEMTRRSPRFRKLAGVETSVNSIFQERSASKFVPISSDSKGLEGLNVHFAVLDEVGSHKTGRVYDVILTGLGKRLQPMLVTISTATSNNTGVGKQLWNYTIKILEQVLDDDRFFGVIYAADEGDDVWSERTMRKANPGWGITVVPEQVRMIARQAKNNPAQETIYKTRHLNIWVTGNQALFSLEHWRACKDESLSLEDFEGQPCILALDVANKVDLAAAVLVFWNEGDDGEDVYSVFAKTWLPEARVDLVTAYAQWQKDDWLTVTPGETTDYSEIEGYIGECCRRFAVQSLPYDPWSATQLAQRMMAQDVPMVEYPMNVSTMSEPTKFLDMIIRKHRVRHNGDPVLAWTLSNVVGHRDAKDNVYPRKQEAEAKIDPAVALIMAIGQKIVREAEGVETIYKDGELRVW